MIEATKSEGREIILIIDEAHTHVSTTLAQKIVDIIDPKIVLHDFGNARQGNHR